ncbi:hypothetical protein [Streptomyces sp. NPDC002215]|uniref:hypothetical protein n=1 Tax=Streptomyces sp. NPDC002215 TaxID=3154412 RepID=UPI00333120F4
MDDEGMRAATRLLGRYRNGYWLRRFLDEAPQREHLQSIGRTGPYPKVFWPWISVRLASERSVCSPIEPFKASSSELAVLRTASSLAGGTAIVLKDVLEVLDGSELMTVQQVIIKFVTGSES